MSRPPIFFQQLIWTALGLPLVAAGLLALVAAWGGYVPDDELALVGTARDRRVWRDLDTAGVRVLGQVTSAERAWCGEDRRTRVGMLVTVPGRSTCPRRATSSAWSTTRPRTRRPASSRSHATLMTTLPAV